MCMFWYEILYHKILNKNVEHVIYIFDMRYINKMKTFNHTQALTPSAIGENTFTAISILGMERHLADCTTPLTKQEGAREGEDREI